MKREVFIVEHEKRLVLFAPLKGLILEINAYEKNKVETIINQSKFSLEYLLDIFPELDQDRLLSLKIEPREVTRDEKEFYPDSAVLFTTFDCGLRCVYCYSKAGEQKINMSQQIAKAVVDFIIRNAKTKGKASSSLGFHGGGEPTWNWDVFSFALTYFQEKAREYGIIPEVELATNGMLSKKQINWIIQHMKTVQVSLDGVEEIHDFQRPTAGNGKSFAVVFNTAKTLLVNGVQLVLHCVITEKGADRIPEIVRFFGSNFPNTTVHLEPSYQCGRGLVTGQKSPSAEQFVKGFIEAQEIAKTYNIDLIYSGASPKLTELHLGFCGVSNPNFVVTPTGLVTACHEVDGPNHLLANHFIYGHLDYSSQEFVFDSKKIQVLRDHVGDVNLECQECFAKFYCAGDCLVKRINNEKGGDLLALNFRCKINKELARRYIFSQLTNLT